MEQLATGPCCTRRLATHFSQDHNCNTQVPTQGPETQAQRHTDMRLRQGVPGRRTPPPPSPRSGDTRRASLALKAHPRRLCDRGHELGLALTWRARTHRAAGRRVPPRAEAVFRMAAVSCTGRCRVATKMRGIPRLAPRAVSRLLRAVVVAGAAAAHATAESQTATQYDRRRLWDRRNP